MPPSKQLNISRRAFWGLITYIFKYNKYMTTKTPRTGRPRIFSVGAKSRICSHCKIEKGANDFAVKKDGLLHSYCHLCLQELQKEWFNNRLSPEEKEYRSSKIPFVTYSDKRAKLLLVFGKACQKCGYSKCFAALHFHHIDSSEKKQWLHTYYKSLLEVEAHPERFNLLCSNCHAEAHYFIIGP